MSRLFLLPFIVLLSAAALSAAVTVTPVTAPHGMVVAAHPEAAEIGAEVLRQGGNAVDAAVAVSLALGVAEPFGSGLGGKLALLYFDAATGRTYALDAMDESGSRFVPGTEDRPPEGWGSVCVPGLAAGLHEAHARWGRLPWAQTVAPAANLARQGFEILPKTRQLYAEQLAKLRKPFAREAAAIYLPGGELPAVGARQPNADLAHTLDLLAQHGRDGFYRGPVAEAIARAAAQGGGSFTAEDLAAYRPRLVETVSVDVAGRTLVGLPPPAYGASLIFATLHALEASRPAAPLRTAANLDRIGRTYLGLFARGRENFGDVPDARERALDLIRGVVAPVGAGPAASANEGTTHFVVVDRAGNIVCATQSLSLHFGAGVVAPGTGVVMNNTLSNFAYRASTGANSAGPRKRPTSTIAPIIVLEQGRPVLALGLPGSTRIPSGLLQVLADHLFLGRPIGEAIGDTRLTWVGNSGNRPPLLESENTLPEGVAEELRRLGWTVDTQRAPGSGSHFGGVNAVTLNADGSRTGYADPRRTNAAAGH